MDALPALIVTATAAYVSTNVDGYALLIGFFSNERYRSMEIVAGQFLSMATQLGISIAVMRSGWVAHSPLVGLAGAVPLFAGLKRIARLRRRNGPRQENAVCRASPGHGTFGRVATVTVVTTSVAIDNVMVYSSVIMDLAPSQMTFIAGAFGLLTALLCLCAFWTAGSRSSIPVLQCAANRVAPFMAVAIGVSLFIRFRTFPWIYSLA
ncbi:hypothetical protein GWC77_06310 [Paraburkholderia sp. NMBU_R16]|uniref:cadmium resistance transporter n=1 Tax=Paraburkholderia sp. NMBU_R16 TaxID=2698676 RepID=UPI0015674628|nr:cadmium resistance transporter [Paraburkholderia sp. NMBU_R16]NRO95550.1 hypothetical protein [Paraburkholderia sp. NMBU_R16]